MLRKTIDLIKLVIRLPLFAIRGNHIELSARIGKNTFLKDTKISHHVFIGQNCCISSANIGAYTCISWNAMIGGMEHDYHFPSINPIINRELDSTPRKNTVIGNDVWIGANCVIRQGVSIGDGVIIGAGSMITHDIPSYTVAYGVPARCIKKRFNKEMEEKVTLSKFWEQNPSEATKIINDILKS